MKLTNEDYNCLVGLMASADTPQEAKVWLQMWFDDKAAEVYKRGWQDACEEYDIDDSWDWQAYRQ